MSIYKTRIEVARPDHLAGGSWVIDELNQVTVLFGRNGIGKSILLRALRAQNPQSYHYASPERAGEISHDMNIAQEGLGARRGNRRGNNFANT
jgi:ABC-type cobalamin/Fe3+-siderophores transport system ATPase subunit